MLFSHKGLRRGKNPLSLVAYDRKTAILRVQMWSTHSRDVVGLINLCFYHAQGVIPTMQALHERTCREVPVMCSKFAGDSAIFAGKSQVLSVHIIYPVDVMALSCVGAGSQFQPVVAVSVRRYRRVMSGSVTPRRQRHTSQRTGARVPDCRGIRLTGKTIGS